MVVGVSAGALAPLQVLLYPPDLRGKEVGDHHASSEPSFPLSYLRDVLLDLWWIEIMVLKKYYLIE
jgi:hypothetical protein